MSCTEHNHRGPGDCPACAARAELNYLTETPHRARDPMHEPRIAELRGQTKEPRAVGRPPGAP